jgi:adenylosuccinate synthase
VGSLDPNPLKDFLWDGKLSGAILCEGAQSIWLDINYGNYPYVTSSETFPHNACSLGFSPKKIREIIGVAKIYDTKSGVDPLFPEALWSDPELSRLIEPGQEYGATTGRRRTVNWLNLDKLLTAINLSGTTKLTISILFSGDNTQPLSACLSTGQAIFDASTLAIAPY